MPTLIYPRYKIGQAVTVREPVTKRDPARPGERVQLLPDARFTVASISEYAGSPEYGLTDANGQTWSSVPEFVVAAAEPGAAGSRAGHDEGLFEA